MTTPVDLTDATVLLVDDRPENLVALAAILEPLGHRLLRATSGQEALRHLLAEEVDLILLDVRMPGMDGFETARQIKERERTSDIPIVFLTAYGDDASAVAAGISSGAVDYLAKPVDATLLRAKAQVLIDLHQRTRSLREEGEQLAKKLDEQYAAEARTLQRLAEAALAINSTQALADMLTAINLAARHVIGANQSETVLLRTGDQAAAASRSFSSKYEGWASSGTALDLSPLYEMVWRQGGPVRMTAEDIRRAFSLHGVSDVLGGHPILEGWLAAPLIGRSGQRLGLIQVADKQGADDAAAEFTAMDESVLYQLAQLSAVAVENAERFELEHSVADALQRALLPRSLPDVKGLEVAARYRAGGAGTDVGGDWYDVVALGDGRVVLTLGDVMGRGPRAAAIMGQLRTALHAYALQDLPPGVAMGSADLLLQDIAEGDIATAVYMVVDPSTGRLDVVTSGHPAPALLEPQGGARYIVCDPHTPLGVLPLPAYGVTTEVLLSGSLVLLYTDGLVERRDAGLDDRLRELLAVVQSGGDDLEALCDHVLDKMLPEASDDDVALLAVRLVK